MPSPDGLSLAPFRAVRPTADGERLAGLLCPPYDVIDAAARQRLLDGDPDNFVAIVLPEPTEQGYATAARVLEQRLADGVLAQDDQDALYVYEMRSPDGPVTRGLVGAVELRDPADGVILPHENTMAGPVADRLAVMTATDSDLEPIYLVYDGGGAASAALSEVDGTPPLAATTTPDGVTHRLWAVTDAARVHDIRTDLAGRRALIADGHHRYATYRERQRQRRQTGGDGPWDRGMALLVDSTQYGPQVHAIHRVVPGLAFDTAVAALRDAAEVDLLDVAVTAETMESALTERVGPLTGFGAVVTDGRRSAIVADSRGELARSAERPDQAQALTELDVTVLHRGVVERAWHLTDDEQHVRYAHSIDDALAAAIDGGGIAVLLRPTSAAAVAAVAAAGARMPRKSTLFTPKPASGMFLRPLRS